MQDSSKFEDFVSFVIEYEVPSSSIPGTRNKGNLYIRGTKGE